MRCPIRFCLLLVVTISFPAAGAQQRSGGTLIFARGGDSAGLDPAYETDGNSFMICDNVFDQLVHYADESTEIVPGLAERWEVSPDGLLYTFYLRRGVVFHDGTECNADAVVFSLGRMMTEKNVIWHGDGWQFPSGQPPAEYWLSMAMDDMLARIEALDTHTVRFQLKRREAPFLANMGMDFASIVSPQAVLKYGDDFRSHPVGSGPFRFNQWIKDDHIILEANPRYWDGRPALDRVIFRTIPDNSVRFLELKTGAVDICQYPNPEDIALARRDSRLKLVSQPGMNVGYLGFNLTKPLWQDVRIRRAVALAINRKAIVDTIYYGLGTVAVNSIPPTMWSWHEGISDYPYDPAVAGQLLAEADFATRLREAGQDSITLWSMPVARPYNPNGMKVGEAIQADLRKVGINLRLVTFEWGTYLKRQRMQPQEMDLFQLGWTGDNGDPDNFLAILLDGLADPNVRTQWKNEEYHRLMIDARQALDRAARIRLYRKAQQLIHREVPLINLAHSLVVWPMKKRVQNFKLHPTGSIRLHKVWLQ